MSDAAFERDRKYLRMDYRGVWGSVWGVRRARRQLQRRWARRNNWRTCGRNAVRGYIEKLAEFGYLGGV